MARAIDQFLAAIRQAIYGRDVREAIASGIEQCYDDSTASAQKADIEAKGAEVLASIPDTYEDLQNDVDGLKSAVSPAVIFDPDWTDDIYLFVTSSHAVNEVESTSYSASGYILIPSGMSAVINTYISGYARVVLYNAAKSWIADYSQTSGVTYGQFATVIDPATVDRYVRISCYKPNKSSAFVSVVESLSQINTDIKNRVKIYGSRINDASDLASLADAVPNTVYTLAVKVEDSQPSVAGTLLTLNYTNDNLSGHAQLFISWDGKMYTRIKWSRSGVVSFSDWKLVLEPNDVALCLKGYGSRITSQSQLASLADAEPNTVYTLTARVDESQPEDAGTLLTLNCTGDNNGGHTQIFVSSTNQLYYRIKWSHDGSVSFYDWQKAGKDYVSDYADATMFERIGVIGDSFASGVIYPSDGGNDDATNTHYEQSWPQCLARICGNTAVNFSVGGCTTWSWMNGGSGGQRNYGLLKMQALEPCGLYLLCLGINDCIIDSQGNPKVALGTVADIGDTTQNTFYRWYGEIVEAIKEKAPNALIVFTTFCRKHQSTDPQQANYSPYYDDYNNAIKAIAAHYNPPYPCLDLETDPFFTSSYYLDGMHRSHPTAPQYSGYAKAINRLLTKSIIDNYEYYSDYNATTVMNVDLRAQSNPVIDGVANNLYTCGTPASVTITPPESGTIFITFESGTTPTTLNVPSNIIWPGWFNPAELRAKLRYEIKITDGIYGSVKTTE